MNEIRPFRLRVRGGISKVRIIILIAVFLLLLSAIAYPAYPGSLGSFVLFDLSFVAMLLLALPQPRSNAYIFFACMLFLGFWMKLMLHLISGDNFREPIGDFSGSIDEWEHALVIASTAAIGVSIARIFQLALPAPIQAGTSSVRVPAWYPALRRPVWIASLCALVALNLLNFQVAFYQTGVNPKLVLPYHLNVPLGWLVSIGFALWFAVLVHWEFQTTPRRFALLLAAPIFEGWASSVSALSRSLYFLHTVAYFFAAATNWAKTRTLLSYQKLIALVAIWAVAFAMSVVLVQFLRIHVYFLAYEPAFFSVPGQKKIFGAPSAGVDSTNQFKPMAREASKLFVDRWIGLEGVLAVSSYPRVGLPLFVEALVEDPKKGAFALYQKIGKSNSEISDRFTFGTLPGIAAILAYSGSLAVVIIGTMLVTLLMIGTELAALRFTANPFLTSITALGLANVVCQSNFPYLVAVFIAQLWVVIVFIWLLQRAGSLPAGMSRHV